MALVVFDIPIIWHKITYIATSYRYILSAQVTQPGVPFECIGVKKARKKRAWRAPQTQQASYAHLRTAQKLNPA